MAALLPAQASATIGVGATVGMDKDPYARTGNLVFEGVTDPGGTYAVTLSCDSLAHETAPVAFANPLAVSLDIPGCQGYGAFDLVVTVRDGVTQVFQHGASTSIAPQLTLSMPDPAITGHMFTINPQWPVDYTPPAFDGCRWEFRWGDNRALNLNDANETFGSMLFDVPTVGGACPTWTFDLPWVPYRQYEATVSLFTLAGGGHAFGGTAMERFTATVDGVGRRITTSTLPIAQVLPNTYTPIVGSPITYTRYLVGGATAGVSIWDARLGGGDNPPHWTKGGASSTFTVTPWSTGNLVVGWTRTQGDFLLGANYDPPVRYRDWLKPNTTAPVQRIGTGAVSGDVPVALTWTAADRGWGLDRYQLDKRVDGGAWTRVANTKSKSCTVVLPQGHAYRFRIRAIDKAGNVGAWDEGVTFRPGIRADASSSIVYARAWVVTPDVTALGGSLHETDVAGASATLTFVGRDVAWLAERGPTHGKAKIYIDGVYAATVDLNAVGDSARAIVFRRHWVFAGTHRLRVVALGTVGRPTVDVDGFIILR